jgi:hypothetical protein
MHLNQLDSMIDSLAPHRGIHKVQNVRDDLRSRIVRHDIPVVISEAIARRRRRQCPIVGRRHRPQPNAVKPFTGPEVVTPIGMVTPLTYVPLVMGPEMIAILGPKMILCTGLLVAISISPSVVPSPVLR